ncbi:hypothetical protein [Geodermatophilus poikilotrophus]|uniref:Uncharacterized protein n=1 Tax=Geodermatophilus poikilotrophus TaxID=1333667 RepID=A0A1I0CHQ3_9ACTN|nr:hypothetical protein [Geodermatophilus poikilotrophus]SET18676.1 hypothetical protein SAMN04488546_1574 [Geodermatophilus poikilotrophus]
MREFIDEVAVLSRWLGRDVATDLDAVVPDWNVFRFHDAVVFEPDVSECVDCMYLVCGESVREFSPSRVTIDEAYAELVDGRALPAVA